MTYTPTGTLKKQDSAAVSLAVPDVPGVPGNTTTSRCKQEGGILARQEVKQGGAGRKGAQQQERGCRTQASFLPLPPSTTKQCSPANSVMVPPVLSTLVSYLLSLLCLPPLLPTFLLAPSTSAHLPPATLLFCPPSSCHPPLLPTFLLSPSSSAHLPPASPPATSVMVPLVISTLRITWLAESAPQGRGSIRWQARVSSYCGSLGMALVFS